MKGVSVLVLGLVLIDEVLRFMEIADIVIADRRDREPLVEVVLLIMWHSDGEKRCRILVLFICVIVTRPRSSLDKINHFMITSTSGE